HNLADTQGYLTAQHLYRAGVLSTHLFVDGLRATIFSWSWWRRLWRSALPRCRSSMKTARSMSWPFKKGLASVSPAWMRAVRKRKLCERRCIRSSESKRLSPSRGLSTGYGHGFTNRSEKMGLAQQRYVKSHRNLL